MFEWNLLLTGCSQIEGPFASLHSYRSTEDSSELHIRRRINILLPLLLHHVSHLRKFCSMSLVKRKQRTSFLAVLSGGFAVGSLSAGLLNIGPEEETPHRGRRRRIRTWRQRFLVVLKVCPEIFGGMRSGHRAAQARRRSPLSSPKFDGTRFAGFDTSLHCSITKCMSKMLCPIPLYQQITYTLPGTNTEADDLSGPSSSTPSQ